MKFFSPNLPTVQTRQELQLQVLYYVIEMSYNIIHNKTLKYSLFTSYKGGGRSITMSSRVARKSLVDCRQSKKIKNKTL